ncbi:unnamed protein product [Prunus armeniaca]|uniref:Uncharacterized protein n=1 Tax=Prunus armeniaca TaxID=36596 RepID=A0A6J5VD70_PRUAR|nr:unnamed protein product [Prunus armeniaca]
MDGKIGQVGGNSSTLKKLPSSVGNLTALELLRLDGSAIEELPSSIGNLTVLKKLYLRGCENLANMPQSIYGLQNLGLIDLSRCPKLVTLPNNLISEGLSNAESLPLEVRTNANNPRDGDFMRHGEIKCVNLRELNLRGCKRLVEILVQLPASVAMIDMTDCISLERFSTLSKILEDEDMQGISNMDLSNCHRLCDNLGLDLSKMAKFLLNQMKRSERIIVTLLDSGSEVPEWFTFGDDFDDYDESEFDYVDVDGRSFRNYKLHIEIPWTSVLENTKLIRSICLEERQGKVMKLDPEREQIYDLCLHFNVLMLKTYLESGPKGVFIPKSTANRHQTRGPNWSYGGLRHIATVRSYRSHD